MKVEQYATLDGASDIWDVKRLESTVFPSSVTSPFSYFYLIERIYLHSLTIKHEL